MNPVKEKKGALKHGLRLYGPVHKRKRKVMEIIVHRHVPENKSFIAFHKHVI